MNWIAWPRTIWRLCRIYAGQHGRMPNLLAPRRFSEKMQWRKLFVDDPLYTTLCDKRAVRDYIAARIGDAHLVPLLWSGKPEDIPFGGLEPPYVLKSTHASGHVLMIREGDTVDCAAIRGQAESWLAEAYGVALMERGYFDVPRQIIAERMISDPSGAPPEECRFFVFDGEVAFINTVFTENGAIRNGAFHRPDWTRLDWYFNRQLSRDFARPQRLPEMIRAAELLGAGLDHLRVDFYDCGAQFYVGELTLYSWSGLSKFNPADADLRLGAHWRLRRPVRRALAAILNTPATPGPR